MIWESGGIVKMEKGEPSLRSCWECNPAHERLKTVNSLHTCYECNRYWIFDRFLDSFESDEEFDDYFKSLGMRSGDSTTKIDKGYRINVFEMKK